jgi:hypothetical protein
MFRKYLYDCSRVINHEYVKLNESLSYIGHSTTIIDKKMKPLCSKNTVLEKILWLEPSGEETTWEPEDIMRAKSIHTYSKIKASS